MYSYLVGETDADVVAGVRIDDRHVLSGGAVAADELVGLSDRNAG